MPGAHNPRGLVDVRGSWQALDTDHGDGRQQPHGGHAQHTESFRTQVAATAMGLAQQVGGIRNDRPLAGVRNNSAMTNMRRLILSW
jgi:hypothetical protein